MTAPGDWFTPRAKAPDPPRASAKWLARLERVERAAREAEAKDDGLLCCPRCGATRGVGLATAPTSGRDYTRHRQGRCLPCGFHGPILYGAQPARDAWNAIDRSHLETE